MQFNITTDYAIRTVLFLAIQQKRMTSLEISQAMVIPRNYQLKITGPLVKAGILKRTQGMKGGFCLGRAASAITLYDIVDVMESTKRINRCLEEDAYCSRFATEHCPVRQCYEVMQTEIERRLKEVTMEKLVIRLMK
ncbi:MAG: Rrf2 family transcriptional regulator [Megasphaera sp.]|jgi:Rrf2 family nitric oxide-sensitive transcriptional repressor|nr:Rrf2 family transcriptional regulator [Megasphaera sp.]